VKANPTTEVMWTSQEVHRPLPALSGSGSSPRSESSPVRRLATAVWRSASRARPGPAVLVGVLDEFLLDLESGPQARGVLAGGDAKSCRPWRTHAGRSRHNAIAGRAPANHYWRRTPGMRSRQASAASPGSRGTSSPHRTRRATPSMTPDDPAPCCRGHEMILRHRDKDPLSAEIRARWCQRWESARRGLRPPMRTMPVMVLTCCYAYQSGWDPAYRRRSMRVVRLRRS